MNILLVDDERLLVKGLKNSLEQEGFEVFTAYDGNEAINIVKYEKVDLIVLDLMLPEIDGMTVCKIIRSNKDIPIIMLTAKDDYIDKILGLEMGADDYMTKPFHTRELIARIKAVHRRFKKNQRENNVIKVHNLKLYPLERAFFIDDKEVTLTAKEFDILNIFFSNQGIVFSRQSLYEHVWNEPGLDTRTVDVHISKLREKIEEDPSNPKVILTKWGVGYYVKKDRL
ncbi:response regulator transcription factor [Sporosalibacterium faouarense]|uniref:response regulator transcription factor n=1 Tax=Sporosalibacterium faouarense TaxID=516123 RepID=UPI00141CA30F|nr:response regulator transcription factor [Sporosalibacterium faouarense]MTI46460.1 response regulator transcription factor [Bacillota bacterium]